MYKSITIQGEKSDKWIEKSCERSRERFFETMDRDIQERSEELAKAHLRELARLM